MYVTCEHVNHLLNKSGIAHRADPKVEATGTPTPVQATFQREVGDPAQESSMPYAFVEHSEAAVYTTTRSGNNGTTGTPQASAAR